MTLPKAQPHRENGKQKSHLAPALLRNAGLALLLFAGLPAKAVLEVGDTVPKLNLMTADGKKIDVLKYAKSQQKRNLLFLFFRTGNCGVCVSQLTDYAEHLNEVSDANAALLTLSLDDAIVQTRVAEKIQHKFPILLDPDAKTVHLFGAFNPDEKLSRPTTLVIGPDNKLLFKYVGKNLTDRPARDGMLNVLNHYSGKLPTKDRGVASAPQK